MGAKLDFILINSDFIFIISVIMGKNKKKGASRIEKASAKREKKIAQRIKKDIGKIGEVNINKVIKIN